MSAQAETVTVTVNGHERQVVAGGTILQTLAQQGIDIPSLCHDPRLARSNGSCGLCVVEVGTGTGTVRDVKACLTPISAGMTITSHDERLDAYRTVRLEQLLCDHNADCVAPCVQACPANVDVQAYLRRIGDGNFEAAVRVIKERNPFPSVCGRVCPHPCEAVCRRELVDEPVAINHVKRFAADWDLTRPTPWVPSVADPTGMRIAVVGAGPSGLSAAYYAARAGHEVTVFEKQRHAGGMMRYGIPDYRLPKAALDREIAVVEALGVHIVTGKALGVHLRLEDLQHDFDAVYLAIGSWRAVPLRIDGDNLPGVWLGISYLERVTKGDTITLGRTVVIGGGNTAIDCARTALRNGAQGVTLVYRRTREEMPAEPYEVAAALDEGVEAMYLTAPNHIRPGSRGGLRLHCLRMALGEPDRSGRRRPVPVEGSDFEIEADTLIGAIGQSTDTGFLYNDLPVRLNKWGDIDVDGTTMVSSEHKVFAGGDCVTGPATVIEAVAAGRRAASAMDEFVTRGYVRPSHVDYACRRTAEDISPDELDVPHVPRARLDELEIAERVTSFAEVESGLGEAEARTEARRCLRCGCDKRYDCSLRDEATRHELVFETPLHVRPSSPVATDHPFIMRDSNKCIACGRCVAACAELEGVGVLAFQFSGGQLRVGTHNDQPLELTDCVSCGQCVRACPCGALDYRRERGVVHRAINDPSKTVVGFVAPAVRTVIAATYGLSPDEVSPFIAGLMRKVGFDKVFDFAFAADLTVVEEATEFLGRIDRGGLMPQFTSCCPGWVNFVKRRYPGLVDHLSSCRSPQQMMGATVKSHFAKTSGLALDDLFVVSIVPCMAKKTEAAWPELEHRGIRDVDAVVTSTELIEMVLALRVRIDDVEPGPFDAPYAEVSGAGMLFGASGGVAVAAMRMAAEKLSGKPLDEPFGLETLEGTEHVRSTTVSVGGRDIRVAVVSGLGSATPLVERVLAGEDVGYDLIEVMACPGGCINGAGNPAALAIGEAEGREQVLVGIDQASQHRTSQTNPDILRLYDDFYGEPGSPLAHRLLHTDHRPFQR